MYTWLSNYLFCAFTLCTFTLCAFTLCTLTLCALTLCSLALSLSLCAPSLSLCVHSLCVFSAAEAELLHQERVAAATEEASRVRGREVLAARSGKIYEVMRTVDEGQLYPGEGLVGEGGALHGTLPHCTKHCHTARHTATLHGTLPHCTAHCTAHCHTARHTATLHKTLHTTYHTAYTPHHTAQHTADLTSQFSISLTVSLSIRFRSKSLAVSCSMCSHMSWLSFTLVIHCFTHTTTSRAG